MFVIMATLSQATPTMGVCGVSTNIGDARARGGGGVEGDCHTKTIPSPLENYKLHTASKNVTSNFYITRSLINNTVLSMKMHDTMIFRWLQDRAYQG